MRSIYSLPFYIRKINLKKGKEINCLLREPSSFVEEMV